MFPRIPAASWHFPQGSVFQGQDAVSDAFQFPEAVADDDYTASMSPHTADELQYHARRSIVRADRPKSEAKGKKRKTNMRSDAVVLLAADNDRTAYAFDEHSHGFLTYFLLKEIKFLKDDIFNNTYQDLYESIFSKLSKESALQNRWQEISGMAGGRYKDAWRGMKIK